MCIFESVWASCCCSSGAQNEMIEPVNFHPTIITYSKWRYFTRIFRGIYSHHFQFALARLPLVIQSEISLDEYNKYCLRVLLRSLCVIKWKQLDEVEGVSGSLLAIFMDEMLREARKMAFTSSAERLARIYESGTIRSLGDFLAFVVIRLFRHKR